MLDKDESLITYKHNPKVGSIVALKNAFTGWVNLNIKVNKTNKLNLII